MRTAVKAAYPDPPNPKQLKFIVIISTSSSFRARIFTEEATLPFGALKLLGAWRGLNGEDLPLVVTGFTRSSASTCDITHYKSMHTLSEQLLQELADTELLASNPAHTWINVYSLIILRNSETWKACSNYLNDLVTSQVEIIDADVVQCPYSWNDPDYLNNPCCSNIKAWETPCVATPGTVEITTFSMSASNEKAVLNQCATGVCISSFLGDYVNTKNNGAACKDNSNSFQNSVLQTIELQRNCRFQVFGTASASFSNHGKGIPCNQDSDCSGSHCNFFYRVCHTT